MIQRITIGIIGLFYFCTTVCAAQNYLSVAIKGQLLLWVDSTHRFV